ncbi:hypothetical protein BDW22DRAFT_1062935 [Trametopsis cervina]|nr:hypothetical protein BDW22DRAFT_1062935 [Trametopsis cervina]
MPPDAQSSAPRIDSASLVDPALHSPQIMEMLNSDLSRPLLEYIVDRVVDVVDYALGRPSSTIRGRTNSRGTPTKEFPAFAKLVIERAGIQMPGLLGTLVYLDRAKPHLQLSLEEWACERVFLGALICSNKYLNDSTLKNVHWSMCTGLFNRRDIGRIEREFLDVLDFELRMSEADILAHYKAVMALQRPRTARPRMSTLSPTIPTLPRSTVRPRSDSDSSTYSDDSISSEDSLPSTPPESAMDLDARVRSPSDASVYSYEEEEEDLRDGLPRLLSPPPKEKTKGEAPALPRFSSAFNLLRNVPRFHATS